MKNLILVDWEIQEGLQMYCSKAEAARFMGVSEQEVEDMLVTGKQVMGYTIDEVINDESKIGKNIGTSSWMCS